MLTVGVVFAYDQRISHSKSNKTDFIGEVTKNSFLHPEPWYDIICLIKLCSQEVGYERENDCKKDR